MKHQIQALFAAAALLASGFAHAQFEPDFTLEAGGPSIQSAWFTMTMPLSSGTLTFSDDLIGALAVAGIQTTVIGPATGTVSDTAISITAPIHTASGVIIGGPNYTLTPSFTHASTLGGATMVAPKANFATNGGSLSVTGISVDLPTQGIYAKVSGANGLMTQNVRVWDFKSIEGAIELLQISPPLKWPEFQPAGSVTITGLTITDQAFDLFAQGLGLKAGGIAAMASISDYGVMTATIPEPSTYLMMGLGLVGLSWLARRHSAA